MEGFCSICNHKKQCKFVKNANTQSVTMGIARGGNRESSKKC